MTNLATVLPSSLSSRYTVVAVLVATTGSSARIAMTPARRTPTGPPGRSAIRCGRDGCHPVTSSVSSSPASVPARVLDSRNWLPPRPGAHSSVSPALCSRQSKVSSQVTRWLEPFAAGLGLPGPSCSGATPNFALSAVWAAATMSSHVRGSLPPTVKPARPGVIAAPPGDTLSSQLI
ncbi:MAG TPA: hypothetical protein VFO01_09280 [Trebonia sp.]|nr:hypothetical protein [Trebonia sp.]